MSSKVEFVSGRDTVIESAIDVVENASRECLGMGRQVAWIRYPGFKAAVKEAIEERNVSLKVIGVDEGNVDEFAGKFEDQNADVKYYDHGDVRIAVADADRALLAVPKTESLGAETSPEYAGIVVEDEEFCKTLQRRFEKYWTEAAPRSEPIWRTLADEVRDHPGRTLLPFLGYVGYVVTAVVVGL